MADQQQPQPQRQEMNAVRAGGLNLPPGFRFHPTDDEIVIHYLMNKVRDTDYTCIAIGEVDLNKTEPWNLPDEAKRGEKEWYFFYQKDRKYPTGIRANRATKAGYWKATGKDKEVYNTTKGLVLLVGMKKTLVFYKGRAPRGDKTNWVMHEYRLEGSGRLPGPASTSNSSATNVAATMKASTSASKMKFAQDEWVVCRVFDKTTRIKKTTAPAYQVAMVGAEIENNIMANPIPMQLPLPMPMPMQLPILPDFAMDPVAPYYHNTDAGMPPMVQPMAGIGGAGGLQINDALFGNPMAAPPPMNFYHHQMGMEALADQMGMEVAAGQMGMGVAVGQMGMGAVASQIDMGAVGVGGFNVAAPESRPSSMVLQQDEQANAADISSMMSVTGPRSTTTTIEMDGIWKYKC